MSAAALLVAVALANEPPSPERPDAPEPLDVEAVEEMAPADIAATLRALQAEVASQRAELQALRSAPEPLPSEPEPDVEAPLVVPNGTIAPDTVGFGQDVHVLGEVQGDVTAFGADVHVFPSGRVTGAAVAVGGNVVIDDGGTVLGNRLAVGGEDWQVPDSESPWSMMWASVVRRLVFFLSFAGAGVLVLGLFPSRVSRVSKRIANRPGRSLASGVFGTGLLGMAAVVFAVTIIGLPISLLLTALFGMAWLLGFVALCQTIGDRMPLDNRLHGRWLVFLAGSTLITVFGLLPWVGAATVALTTVMGVGAALTTRLGSRA